MVSPALPNRGHGNTNGHNHLNSASEADESPSPTSRADAQDTVIQEIFGALQGLQFGEVTITVRDGRIVQIERIARKRQFPPKHT